MQQHLPDTGSQAYRREMPMIEGAERKRFWSAFVYLFFDKMAIPAGVEPATYCLEGSCSIH